MAGNRASSYLHCSTGLTPKKTDFSAKLREGARRTAGAFRVLLAGLFVRSRVSREVTPRTTFRKDVNETVESLTFVRVEVSSDATTRAPTRGAPTGGGVAGYGSRGAYEGTHKGCPYGGRVGGIWESWRVRGHPQGVPLRGRAGWRGMGVVARTRAPTRGAPTGGGLAGYGSRGAYEGTHKGCPYGGGRVGRKCQWGLVDLELVGQVVEVFGYYVDRRIRGEVRCLAWSVFFGPVDEGRSEANCL